MSELLEGNLRAMNIEYRELEIESIDLADTTFVITFGLSLSMLRDSIENIGVLNPPVIKEKLGDGYCAVCGYKRLLVCRDLGISRLRCAIIDHGAEDRDAFLLSFYDNLSHRQLNPMEKSMAIAGLQRYYADEFIVRNFLPLLGLPPRNSVLMRIKSLLDLDQDIKDALADNRLDEGAAIKLLNFSSQERIMLFQFLTLLKFSRNKRNEIIDTIYDITQRDECSMSDILNSKGLKDILGNKELNIPQKGKRVRHLLRKLRYPKIVKAEEDFLRIQGELDLGDDIRLTPPPFFEGERYGIEFEFGTINELEENVKKIESIKYHEEFTRAIEG